MTTPEAIDDNSISYRRRLRKQTQIASLAIVSTFVGYRKYFHWLTQVLAMTNEACFNGQRNDSYKKQR